MPFATAKSIPQLIKSINQLASDRTATELPSSAWSQPDQLHFVIGGLILPTQSRLKAAIELLQGIDLTQTVRSSYNSSSELLNFHITINTDAPGVEFRSRVITLQGLRREVTAAHWPRATKALSCDILESWPYLTDLEETLKEAFAKEGLMPVIKQGNRELGYEGKIMTTCYLRTIVQNTRRELRGQDAVRRPHFDALDIYHKFKNFTWATQFPLERISISQLGLKDVWIQGDFVRTCYRNDGSAFLPGTNPSQTAAADEHPEDVYEKAAHTIRENQSVPPLYIPSTPPSSNARGL